MANNENLDRARLVQLARQWENEAEQVIRNIEAGCFLGTDRKDDDHEGARTSHGFLIHCAGQLLDAIGESRTLDETKELGRCLRAIAVARSDA